MSIQQAIFLCILRVVDQRKRALIFNLRSWQTEVLPFVLEACPAAAAEKDSTGNLPPRTAVEHGACVEVVDMLLKKLTLMLLERETRVMSFRFFFQIIAGQAAARARRQKQRKC